MKKVVKNIRKAKRRFEKKLAAGGRWQQAASLCLCQPVEKKQSSCVSVERQEWQYCIGKCRNGKSPEQRERIKGGVYKGLIGEVPEPEYQAVAEMAEDSEIHN